MDAQITEWGRIAGTRSSVYDVVYYLEWGRQPQEIADLLRVSLEQVQAAIQYINEHKEAVMAVHRQIEERNARGNPPEIRAKLEETRAKMQAWLAARREATKQEANGAGDHGRR